MNKLGNSKGIMREIHNSKLRMPVILTEGNERSWLMGQTKGDLNLGFSRGGQAVAERVKVISNHHYFISNKKN